MRVRGWSIGLVVVAVAAVGCGSSSSSGSGTTAPSSKASTTTPALGASSSTKTPMGAPTGAKVRIANLFAPGGQPGPALDVYDIYQPKKDDKPLISGLAYGQVSDVIMPRAPQYGGDAMLGYFVAGTKDAKDPKNAPYQLGSYPPSELGKGVVDDIVVFTGEPSGGTGTGWGTTVSWADLAEAGPSANGSNNAYGPPAGKSTLLVDSQPVDSLLPSGTQLYVGMGGTCLRALGTGSGSDPLPISGTSVFEFDPSSVTVGIFVDTSGPPTCSGTPTATTTVALPSDGSVIAYVYGTSATDLHLLTVPTQTKLPEVTTTTSG